MPKQRSLLSITILRKTSITPSGQTRAIGILDRASQAEGPILRPVLRRNFHAVGDHALRLGLQVLEFRRGFVGGEGVVDVGQVDDEHGIRFVAAEEGGALVQAFRDEGRDVGDVRHFGQPDCLRAEVGFADVGAVGEVVGGVGAVVVGDEHVDVAVRLDHRPDGDVLVAFAAVGEGEVGLCADEARAGVVVEGVRVDAEDVVDRGRLHEGDDAFQDAGEVVGAVRGRDLLAHAVEDVGACAEHVADVVVVFRAFGAVLGLAVAHVRAHVLRLRKGRYSSVPRAIFVGGEFEDGPIFRGEALIVLGKVRGGGNDWIRHVVAGEVA